MQTTISPAPEDTQNDTTVRRPLAWFSFFFILGIFAASRIPLDTFVNLPVLQLMGQCAPSSAPLISFAQQPVARASLIAFGAALVFLILSIVVKRIPKIQSWFAFLTPLRIACVMAFFFGASWYLFWQPDVNDPSFVAFYNDRDYEVFVTGCVADMPDERDTYTNLQIEVQSVDTGSGDLPASGLILVRVRANEKYEYGQMLRLRGNLATPPENEDFSYRDYLAIQGIHAYIKNAEATILPGNEGNPFFRWVYTVKQIGLRNVYRLFPDPEASLLAGILLGVDTGLTKELQQAFKTTGTSHIIAISGFNISIIAGLVTSFFNRLMNPRRAAVAAFLGIAFYTILVGADAAVVRAAIMGGFSLFARQVGRRNDGLNTLAIVAFLMALINPMIVWDVGFQLSFGATLGLVLYAESFARFTHKMISFLSASLADRIIQPISDFVLLTLAAQLTTLPIMAYHFKQLSLVAFVANPFLLPVQPAVMLISGAALLLSYVSMPLGQVVAWLAWPFAAYTIRGVEFFNWPSWILYLDTPVWFLDVIPWPAAFTKILDVAQLNDAPFWFAVLFYVILLSMTFFSEQIKNFFKRAQGLALSIILLLLFTCVVFTWKYSFGAPDGKLHITFLNAGSADAILVQTPSGRAALINGGPSASRLSDSLGRRLLPFSRRLDWLVIASTDENQIAALPRVMERYPPENALWSGNVQASFSASKAMEWLIENQIPVTRAEADQSLDLGDGAALKIQSVGPRGSVLVIEWNNFRALLPIGADASTLDMKLESVDVLLLANSGYGPSNPESWIKDVNPQLIVLSVAAGDADGLPSQATLDAVGGYTLLRTDINGWISIATDGNEMQVEVENGD